tara:strand:- start:1137 stop:1556 length:420 start_codon:yes stop_codon:yes gene_type:complete
MVIMVSTARTGELVRRYFEDINLVKMTLTGTITGDMILAQAMDPPDIMRWNRIMWNFLEADLSELQLQDAKEISEAVQKMPTLHQARYRMAFVVEPGPKRPLLRMYDVLMADKNIEGRSFEIFDTEDAAMDWLMSDSDG